MGLYAASSLLGPIIAGSAGWARSVIRLIRPHLWCKQYILRGHVKAVVGVVFPEYVIFDSGGGDRLFCPVRSELELQRVDESVQKRLLRHCDTETVTPRKDATRTVRELRDDLSDEFGDSEMTCRELAARIEELQPEAMPRDVARLCLLLTNSVQNIGELASQEALSEAWLEMGMRLQAATDQHAAMTEELEDLAQSDPAEFSMDQVWVLIRAIKVQSQILQLYVGRPTADV